MKENKTEHPNATQPNMEYSPKKELLSGTSPFMNQVLE
jgi:hypothetical protein